MSEEISIEDQNLPHIPPYARKDDYEPGKDCPECGCQQFEQENAIGPGYRVCVKCGQEWWTDIDYSQP